MELITILNRCHRFRGFVYQHAHFSADKKSIEVTVRPRKRSAAVCSRCHLPAPGYDQLAEIRAGESRRIASEGGVPVLKKSRWLLLKREENLKTEQRFRLRDLLRCNLKTVRAYLLKDAFQQLWDYNSPAWAGKFLDDWCRQVMRSRIEPMKKIARSLRQHRALILNYFRP